MAFLEQEQYDAGYYASHVERYIARTRFTRHRLKNVFDLAGDVRGKRVLDLGCGMGTFALEAARLGADALGVDPAPAAIAVARDLAQKLGYARAAFLEADAAELPVTAETFDVVICADLTEHLDDETLSAILTESRRVLRPGGRLALYTPSPTHLFERLKARGWLLEHDPSHIGLRGMPDLRAAVTAAGFEIDRAYFRPTHIPAFNVAERTLQPLPGVGRLFRRRVCIAARKPVG